MCGPGSMPSFLGEKPGQRAQGGQDMRGIGVTDLATVFVIRAIPDIVVARLDGPVPANDTQQELGIFLCIRVRPDAGDCENGFLALDTGR